MNRRELLGSTAATILCCSGRLSAQQLERKPRVARLSPLSRDADKPMIDGLLTGLRERGWIEGQNFTLEMRFADGDGEKLQALAAELVALNVDVIVTGSNPGALAAKRATGHIPVVFITTGDPISGGLVSSFRRPEGNLTEVTALGVELAAKRLEFIKESFGGKRIVVLTNPGSPYTEEFLSRSDDLARTLAVELRAVPVGHPKDLTDSIGALRHQEVDSLLVLADIMFITQGQRIVNLVSTSGIPAMYPERAFIEAGGLMFYGAGLRHMYRHAATYVDKILRGAKPSELPVEQPTSFELVINLKAARAMNISIPPALLARADEVIE